MLILQLLHLLLPMVQSELLITAAKLFMVMTSVLKFSVQKGWYVLITIIPENHRYFASDGVHGSLPLNFFMDRYLEAYANEMKIFCDAVINDKELPVSGNDGLMSVAIALAAKKSHLENRPVKLNEIV